MHTHSQWSVSSLRAMRYMHDGKFGMLQVRENAISLRKWSGGTARLRTSEGREHWGLALRPSWYSDKMVVVSQYLCGQQGQTLKNLCASKTCAGVIESKFRLSSIVLWRGPALPLSSWPLVTVCGYHADFSRWRLFRGCQGWQHSTVLAVQHLMCFAVKNFTWEILLGKTL